MLESDSNVLLTVGAVVRRYEGHPGRGYEGLACAGLGTGDGSRSGCRARRGCEEEDAATACFSATAAMRGERRPAKRAATACHAPDQGDP